MGLGLGQGLGLGLGLGLGFGFGLPRGHQLGDAVGAGLVVGVEEDDHLLVDDGERVLEVVRLGRCRG